LADRGGGDAGQYITKVGHRLDLMTLTGGDQAEQRCGGTTGVRDSLGGDLLQPLGDLPQRFTSPKRKRGSIVLLSIQNPRLRFGLVTIRSSRGSDVHA